MAAAERRYCKTNRHLLHCWVKEKGLDPLGPEAADEIPELTRSGTTIGIARRDPAVEGQTEKINIEMFENFSIKNLNLSKIF